MSIAVFLKDNLTNIPPSVGKILNRAPYSLRPGLGKIYKARRKEINNEKLFDINQKQDFVFTRLKNIVDYAYHNTIFYKEYYDRHNFHPSNLNSFIDIQLIPIIDKSILMGYNIEQRSSLVNDRYTVNTGGSSGTPFSFYIDPNSMGHEWAHMHTIWEKLGYKHTDLKLLFGGRSDIKEVIDYDVLRHHFAVDIYADYKLIANKLKKIVPKHKIKFLHGYPSSIYDFAIYCSKEDIELRDLLRENLKGVFFGSEYPHKQYRDLIEEVFKAKTISWYGHTERAILAYENSIKFRYEPFLTYGFSEAITNNDDIQLIGTSYYNYASPLIRYNTNDIISDIETDNGILKSFKVSKGREGEFVIDKKNKKINLTGLIFGRHHAIFNYCKFIQVKQIDTGKIEIYFVSDNLDENKAAEYFDSENLDLDISFRKRSEPVRSLSGKINLLIK